MKRWIDVALKTLSVAVVTTVVMGPIHNALADADAVLASTGASSSTMLALVLLSELALAVVLVYPVQRSRWRGWRLFGALFFAIFGLSVVLTQVEAAVFLTIAGTEVAKQVLSETVHAALVAGLMVVVFRRRAGDAGSMAITRDSWSAGRWIRRLALCAACYVVLYFGAGMLIWPFIRSFYETQEISAFAQSPWLLPFQLLRGTLYVLFLLPLLRSLAVDRRQAVLTLAALVPVLAGAVGLLIPNPFMPQQVRLLHMFEIGWSNAVYGMLVASLFWTQWRTAGATTAGHEGSESVAA